jgi:hypothetical protein
MPGSLNFHVEIFGWALTAFTGCLVNFKPISAG